MVLEQVNALAKHNAEYGQDRHPVRAPLMCLLGYSSHRSVPLAAELRCMDESMEC